ncbi:hypothetical protein Barb7_01589 [Bacteroidales bacterium Barb7]|nr:hypothetical protein Barb7_01589 [Bacteroidales bacterium Barb7]
MNMAKKHIYFKEKEEYIFSPLQGEIYDKYLAVILAKNTIDCKINKNNSTYSKINNADVVWWLNPTLEKLEYDSYVLLNDQYRFKIYVFKIDKGTITEENYRKIFKLKLNMLDININANDTVSFKDTLGIGFPFDECFPKSIIEYTYK